MAIYLFTLLSSCASRKIEPDALSKKTLAKFSGDNHFYGYLIIDPESNDTIASYNAHKFFTPASNVKIFTLYMGLKILPDSIPAFKYVDQNDTLYVQGTGNPTLLHTDFKDNGALSFLKSKENISLFLDNYVEERYRPGWAWEDYDTYFSPEITSLPLYGNVATITQKSPIKVTPELFQPKVFRSFTKKRREEYENTFYIPYTRDTVQIPFLTSADLTVALLQKATGANVSLTKNFPEENRKVFAGVEADTIYRKMMFESDNFLAEQLVLMASSSFSDTLSFNTAKQQLLETHLNDLRHQPRWVDGSGLSRYNLFTPTSMVQVLSKLYDEVPRKRLFHLFPYWNEDGTIKKLVPHEEIPFIKAKTGSLGNNYNLSGYMTTTSGKVLAFSFMNNHFRRPYRDIRHDIYRMLKSMHDSN